MTGPKTKFTKAEVLRLINNQIESVPGDYLAGFHFGMVKIPSGKTLEEAVAEDRDPDLDRIQVSVVGGGTISLNIVLLVHFENMVKIHPESDKNSSVVLDKIRKSWNQNE
ncbi:MAG: hypothetical protein H7831_16235 [Magnetococcus sp. WYHC-3]